MEAVKHLTRILPNLRGAKQKTRRVLATVVMSRLLYEASIWSQYITAEAMHIMMVAYRRIMLRVACCFRTTSYEAAAVVSSTLPLDLLAIERRRIFEGMDRRVAREQLLVNWQEQWDTAGNGRWTHCLIRDVAAWYRRKHGEVSYHLSQVLTGHGCFGKYLNKFCNLESDVCAQCGEAPDSPEHAMLKCDAWDRWRREACVYLEVTELTAENAIGIMLESRASWERISQLFTRIMMSREEEERRKQQRVGT
ncbi:hypothetical protein AGLY_006970 [Aphis glycines]|uniref:Reverse transcriptase zinc-binding domain-containing protein n=1 Tax=Aphis glycines TaxID=307491 RepID=A0A6G0TPQ7_APHGL|nr:hypothetical protein AGLY_006970 [Aphis glycines]